MADTLAVLAEHPYRFDRNRRAAFIARLRKGRNRVEAASDVGVTTRTVRRRMEVDPEFREEVIDAEMSVIAQVGSVIVGKALGGHVEACKFVLDRRGGDEWAPPYRKGENASQTTTVTLTMDEMRADAKDLVAALIDRKRAEIEARSEPDFIDADSWEDDGEQIPPVPGDMREELGDVDWGEALGQ